MCDFELRPATVDDCSTIVDFNCRLALETEDKQLQRTLVEPGVAALLADSSKGRYFVACDKDRIVGQLMHTHEWSDWRNGDIWWIQSVYVVAEYRRKGIFRMLYQKLEEEARNNPAVVGIRLYVENENSPAQETYNRLGMQAAGYSVMERFFD